jgi:hypothetical protein
VPRDQLDIDPLLDLAELKRVQLLLIDFQCYEKITPRQRNIIMYHVKEIEIFLKNNINKAIKSEFAVKPIKMFPTQVRDNKAEYQRIKNRKS